MFQQIQLNLEIVLYRIKEIGVLNKFSPTSLIAKDMVENIKTIYLQQKGAKLIAIKHKHILKINSVGLWTPRKSKI